VIYIGTSGFFYNHWKGIFYPEELKKEKYLEFYSKNFNCLELNITFYRLPKEKTIENWVKATPDEFCFVCKIWRRISHLKKLSGIKEELEKFLKLMENFGNKLKVLLLQLPPSFKFDCEKILNFYKEYSFSVPIVIEGRNKTFFEENSIEFFKKNKISLASIDSPNFREKYFFTSKPFYLRFHGSKSLYSSLYSKEELEKAANFIKEKVPKDIDIFIFFNNDFGGYAIKNAYEIKELIKNCLP
jgi:uncharacterized protein YecE (DUF72 family)